MGRFFALPLRFIGAIAMGRSSEEVGASSGWLEKPAPRRGHSVASAPRSGLLQVAGPSGARQLPAHGLRAAAPAGANPCPSAWRRQADGQAGAALRVSAPHSHVSPGAWGLPAQVRGAQSGQEHRARAGTRQRRLAPLPCLAPCRHPSICSFFFSLLHWHPQELT